MRVLIDPEMRHRRIADLIRSDSSMSHVLEASIMRNLDHEQDMPAIHMDVLQQVECVQLRLARDKVAASALYTGVRGSLGGLNRRDRKLLGRFLKYTFPHIRAFVACRGTEGEYGELCVAMIAGLCELLGEINKVPESERNRLIDMCELYSDVVSTRPGHSSSPPAVCKFEKSQKEIRMLCDKLVVLNDFCKTI